MTNKRYERTIAPDAEMPKNAELATGIPATPEAPVGSTQFDAFTAAERKSSETALRQRDTTPMEERDKRGADQLDGKGATKARIPMHEVDGLAEEMAGRFANNVDRVESKADGNTLTVRVTTKHGTSNAQADVEDWTAAGVKKALKEIEAKLNGDEDSSSDEPKDKLAEAVRKIAKSKG